MIAFWDILTILTAIQGILSVILFTQVFKLYKRPIGLRLVSLSVILTLEGILGLIIFNYWRSMGYGPTISIPLIVLQLTILLGTIILIDITRR